ncbi:zinc finger protein 318 [Discoglossus pictus]
MLTGQIAGSTVTNTNLGNGTGNNSNLLPVNTVTQDVKLPTQETLKGGIVKSGQFSSQMGNFLNMFNKTACESQGIPYHSPRPFTDPKQQSSESSFPIPHEQVIDVGSQQPSVLDRVENSSSITEKESSISETEDEERFLYEDEHLKKAKSDPEKGEQNQTPSEPETDKQEFEKIHDLLKTIGLDIGVAEIGKLAVRTQERLHGKKVTPQAAQQGLDPRPGDTSAADSKHSLSPSVTKQIEKVPPTPPAKPEQISTIPAAKQKQAPTTPTAKPEQPAMPIERNKPTLPVPQQKVEIPANPVAKNPAIAPQPQPTQPPVSPSQLPVYPPYHASQMVHGYSTPQHSYNAYNPYVSYPASSWSVYGQVHQPPPSGSTITRSNLRIIETSDDVSNVKAQVKSKPPVSPAQTAAQVPQVLDTSESDQKNKDNDKKRKVLEELETLQEEQKVRKQKLYSLNANVEQLRVQQGVLLRKKRREKDGHKDPLLEELNNFMESAKKQMTIMRNEFVAASKKEKQLTVVAEILGLTPTKVPESPVINPLKKQEKTDSPPKSTVPSKGPGRETRTSTDTKTTVEVKNIDASKLKDHDTKPSVETKPKDPPQVKSDTKSSSLSSSSASTEKLVEASKPRSTPPKASLVSKSVPENKTSLSSSSSEKSRSKSPRPREPSSKPNEKSKPFDVSQIFNYFDAGDYWCEDCNSICPTLGEFLTHMHNKKHSQTVNHSKRPWAKKMESETKSKAESKAKVSVPLRGPEFLVPVNGFYCHLCEELFGDHISAEEHTKTFNHNEKYKKHIETNSSYETKRIANRKAGLEAIQEAEYRQKLEQKRKLDEKIKATTEQQNAKKPKKEDEESQKLKTNSDGSTAKSDQRLNPRKPVKTPTFGKFTWKLSESKTQAAIASGITKDESTAANSDREKEDSSKAVKQKVIDIKLSGKTAVPSVSSGIPCTSSPASTFPTPSTTFPTSMPQTKVRPNLPIPMTVLRKSSTASVSKPAPLNTFLSIKTSKAPPKPLPVVKSKNESVLSQDLISKAFGGHEAAFKESNEGLKKQDMLYTESDCLETSHMTDKKPNGKSPAVNTPLSDKPTQQKIPPPQSTIGGQKPQDIYDRFFQKINNLETKVGTATSENRFKTGNTKSEPKKSETIVSVQNQDSAKPAPTLSSLHSPKRPQGASSSTSATVPTTVPKLDAVANSGKVVPEGATVTRNPADCRKGCEETHVSKAKDTSTPKQPKSEETAPPNRKGSETTITQQTNTSKMASSSPKGQMSKTVNQESIYSNTVKLNQKFKREPLSLPSSLFGHMPEISCKDIKITSSGVQNPNIIKEELNKKAVTTRSKEQPMSNPKRKSELQCELDSFYKLIATEDDPGDVTTSEDQDVAMEECSVTPKVEISPKVIQPPPKSDVLASAGDDTEDDEDMACEGAPDVPAYATSSFSGLSISHEAQKAPVAATKNELNTPASKRDQGQVYSPTAYTMDDLSVLTCDSD